MLDELKLSPQQPCSPYRYRSRQSQRGSVLVIAVFVVSVIIAVAARFTGDYQLAIARAEQSLIHSQMQQLLYSVESFASWVIIEDAKDDNNNGRYNQNGQNGSYDHFDEKWITPLQVPVEEAKVNASLEDAQSRFNINQLSGRPEKYDPNGTFSQRYTIAQRRFIRLLQTHPDNLVDPSLAQQITDAVIDWIDSDNTVSGLGGAENDYYITQEPPHLAANQGFISITELQHIRGMTPEIYTHLEPLLVALPASAGININTASVTIMRSINEKDIDTPISQEDANTLIGQRPVKPEGGKTDDSSNTFTTDASPFESTEAFTGSSEFAQIFANDPKAWPPIDGLRTGSEYFILTAQVEMLDYQRYQMSVLKRETADDGYKTRIIRRTREQL